MPDRTTKADAARIQPTQDKAGRDMSSGGFAARAQAAGDRNENANMSTKSYSGYGSGGVCVGNPVSGNTGGARVGPK